MTKLVLRANAAVDAVLGIVLLLATWDGLYRGLHLPSTDEPVYAQVAGAFVAAVAYLLWIAHRDTRLLRAAALCAGFAHLLAAAVAVAWLIETRLDLPGREGLALGAVAVGFGCFAVAELVIASRSIASLVPSD